MQNLLGQFNLIRSLAPDILKRLIEEEIIDEIASLKLEGKIKEGDRVKVEVKEGKLTIT